MKEQIKIQSNSKTVKRLLSYLKPYALKTIFIILILLIIMGINTLNPFLMKVSIDKYIVNEDIPGLLRIGIFIFILNLFGLVLSKIRFISMNKITNKIVLNIRNELYTHIQTLDFSFFDNKPVGKILSRVVGDVKALQNLFGNSILNFIPNIFTIILVVVMMLLMDVKLTLVCLAVLPILFSLVFVIEVKSNIRWRKYRSARSKLLGFTHEAFSGIKVSQGFAKESFIESTFEDHLEDHKNGFIHAVRLQDFFWPIVDIARGVGIAIVLFTGYMFVNGSEQLSIGTLLAFIMYIEMLWRPIMNLASFYNAFVTNLSAAERIFDILDIESNMTDISTETMPEIKGSISFDKVSFSYNKDNNYALKNASFNIKPGEKIALVGETGAGKTTITNLISRFYDATKGSISIDGIDVKSVSIESLRSQMGIMLQDSFLFSTSIKENIKYGKLDATDEEVIAAAKAVHAHEFITKFEDGYETDVNERGSRLSLGQRQLIAFARALIADPKILILDEATANIDTETERLVQDGIKTLMDGRTSIVIAHRLSTIRDCDKIFVLSDGEIVEAGSHQELISSDGFYHKLYTAQYSFLD